MLNIKKDPVFITKVCLIIIAGVFAVSIVGSIFSPRVQAQAAPSSGDAPSWDNPDGIIPGSKGLPKVELLSFLEKMAKTTGIYKFIYGGAEGKYFREEVTPGNESIKIFGWMDMLMILVGFVIIYLGAAKGFEPLLLIPIGFGTVFANIPNAGMGLAPHGFLHIIYEGGVGNEFFPLIIFIGIGALTDFGPLIANPKTALLGAAA